MFDKEFNKLVKAHPERFEYDFEVSTASYTPETQALLDAAFEKTMVEVRKRLADRKMAAENVEGKK